MARSYKELFAKPETKAQVLKTLEARGISPQAMKELRRWVVFEKEAETFLDYLTKNPQADEKTLINTIMTRAWNYAKSIGMSTTHREWYSTSL